MSLEIKTEIIIRAASEKIWAILTEFDEYPKWNPFIKTIKGDIGVGNKIIVQIAQNEGKEMTFKPTILTLNKNIELSWLGVLLFPGIFDGHHKFELNDNNNGTITFTQSEVFKGILVPLFQKQLKMNTKNGFIEMNKKLKELAEN